MDKTGTVRVLHVDDDPVFLRATKRFVEHQADQFEIETATSASDGLSRLREADFDCIVSDYDMPDETGIAFLEAVRKEYPKIPIIFLTGKGGEEVASKAISAGVSDYLQKGSDTDGSSLLANRISNLVSQYRAEAQLDIRVEQQQRVADLGEEALAGVPLEKLFERTVEIVVETLNTEVVDIIKYRPEQQNLILHSGSAWRDTQDNETVIGIGTNSQAEYTLRSEEPLIVEDLRTEDRFHVCPSLAEHDLKSGISVTIGAVDDPWGILRAYTTNKTVFTEDDVTFVQQVSHVLTNAIQRIQREEKLEQSGARYRAVTENFPNGIVALFDDELRYQIVDGTDFENLDLTAEMMEGQRVQDLFSDSIVDQLVPPYRAALNGEHSIFEMTFQGRRYRVHTVPIEVGRQGMVMTQDITKEIEDKRQLETLLDNFPGYIYSHKYQPGWPLEFVKGSVKEVTGYTATELEQDVRLAEQIIHPEDRENVRRDIENCLKENNQYTLTYRINTKEGTERWIWERGTLVEDPITGVKKLEGFITDFSDRKEREQELEKTTAIISTLFDTLPVGVMAEDASRNILAINERLFELFEMPGTPNESIGADCEYMAEQVSGMFVDSERFVEQINELVASNEPTDNEELSLTDGQTFERSHRAIELSDGKGHLWVYREITERKAQQQEREVTIEFLQRFYDVATNRELTTDDKITQLLEIGPRILDLPYGHLTRIERSESNPREGTQTIVEASGNHKLLQPGDSCPLSHSYCRKTIVRDELFEVQNASAMGWRDDPGYKTFSLECYIGKKITVNNKLYGTVFFASNTPCEDPFTDVERTFVRLVSRLVSYELERKQATSELQQQNEQLEKFANIVSHDLRNPLAVAKGRLELAQDECDSEHLDSITKAHDRIEVLIDDLLLLSREGEQVASPEVVDIDDLIEDCWRNVDTAGATLISETTLKIQADRSRLAQLFENLIRNAVEHGGTEATITVGELNNGFYLADNGPGIPPDEREQVFEFGYSTSTEGTGFGLAIVKEIAAAHGWDIRLTENDPHGARFEITRVEIVSG